MGRKKKPAGEVKPKRKKVAVVYEPPRRRTGDIPEVYILLADCVRKWHETLKDAKILIAWHKGWKEDTDGRQTIGKASKASDFDRQVADYDFVITIHEEWWNKVATKKQRIALIDHELCHCEVKCDTSGEPMHDENDRICYRMRKHDVEEFREIITRHGIYKNDLEAFFDAAVKSNKMPLFADHPDSDKERIETKPEVPPKPKRKATKKKGTKEEQTAEILGGSTTVEN